mmetsp:Transcript_69886/g.154586  ORF Transcript_69886/g.154586 Transcript_69886/m.154586 type:complete len:188 (-) Transcript_69886:31-594(-)
MIGGLLGPKLPSMQQAVVDNLSQPQAQQLSQPSSGGGVAVMAVHAPHQAPQMQQQEHIWQQIRELISEEVCSKVSTVQPPPPPARPMQLIINNHSEANCEQKSVNVAPPPPPPAPVAQAAPEGLVEALSTFLASPMNRLGVFTVLGLGLYILEGRLRHNWRMAEMQKRIDANLFLRFFQMVGASPPR